MAKQTFTVGQVLTAAQMTSLQQTAMGGGSTTAKTANYTLVAADAGTVVQMNSASSTTITVNTALFSAGDSVQIQNIGAGVCTVTAGTATVSTAGSLALSQYEGGQLYFNTTSAALFFDIVQTSGMTNPLTTTGDTIYSSSGTTPARLGIGSTGQVLTVASGLPSWATPAASASGLTLISSTSFTTSSGHSVNSCFSATYVNYRIMLKLSAVSGSNTEMTVRLRASGTDATTNYTTMRQLSYSAGVSTDLNPTGTDDWTMGLISSTSPTGLHTGSFEMFDPFAATPTQGTSILNGYYGGSYYLLICENTNTNSTSYDGFSLIPATGTITGTVRVYGYQNS